MASVRDTWPRGSVELMISPMQVVLTERRRRRQAGFTLMELLIVISIMLILMLIAIPNFSSMRMNANETSAMASLRQVNSQPRQRTAGTPLMAPVVAASEGS